MDEVHPRHLFVAHLGVHAHHLVVLERRDERESAADRGQEDVAARLVGLRFEGEPDPVAAVDDVRRQEVDPLPVAVERRPHVLRRVGLGTLPATPEHVRRRAELRGQVEVAHHLAQRVPPDSPVVGSEGAVLEHRVREQIRRHHRNDDARLVERVAEPLDQRFACRIVRAEGDQVVVVERDAPRAELRESMDRLHRIERRSGRVTERVAGLPPDRPQPEGEVVLTCRLRCHRRPPRCRDSRPCDEPSRHQVDFVQSPNLGTADGPGQVVGAGTRD